MGILDLPAGRKDVILSSYMAQSVIQLRHQIESQRCSSHDKRKDWQADAYRQNAKALNRFDCLQNYVNVGEITISSQQLAVNVKNLQTVRRMPNVVMKKKTNEELKDKIVTL